jgi:hypothetical protein
MKSRSKPSLLKQRKKLSRILEHFDPRIIRGSLIERYKRCGKAGCKCMSGKGHGPKYYLTLSIYKGKQDVIYVPLDQLVNVKAYLKKYQSLNTALKEVCDINRELLRRGDTI